MTLLIRGQTVTFGADPSSFVHHEKGAIVIGDDGRILWTGPFAGLPPTFRGLPVDDHGARLVVPGFVDAHIHFPQYRMLAAPGKDLLDWLSRFTFPEESRYADAAHASRAAEHFLDRLVEHGTTSALAFCSVHKTCADRLFAAAQARSMALIAGKSLMDRNAIPAVEDTVEQGARDTEALYDAWHGKGRLRYAVTPRFAVTSTEAQLRSAGELTASLKGVLMQTHLSESRGEIEYVKRLYPQARDYTDVYDRAGLLTDKSLFAHGIHLCDREMMRLAETASTVIHCPTSNTFLGSGLMSMPRLNEHQVALALGSDIGGGTSYSMLQTMAEAYKVQMLNGYRPTAREFFRLSTLGNAKHLRLDDEIGSLAPGKWADLVILDPQATPVLAARHELSQSIDDVLFSLMILGDDRAIRATYIAGRRVHEKTS